MRASVVVLVVCLLGGASCQECAIITENDIENVIAATIAAFDGASTPVITFTNYNVVCLAHGNQRDLYRGASVVVQYTCTGNSQCLDGTVTEQFEAGCEDGSWRHRVLNVAAGTTRTESPNATTSTELREDCSVCISPEHAVAVGGPSTANDDINHCAACVGCTEAVGANRCLENGDCCNVYGPNGFCDTECPNDGVYHIDETFSCIITCSNGLGTTVENGEVEYSPGIVDNLQRYTMGTVAEVTCNDGYTRVGENAVCMANGNWSSALPVCEEREVITCDQAPGLEDGKVSSLTLNGQTLEITQNEVEVDTVATYECENDYTFTSSETTRTCEASGDWSDGNIKCDKKLCPADCKDCEFQDDGTVVCLTCDDGGEPDKDNSCKKVTDNNSGAGPCGKDNIICIIIPIAIILAIILAVAIAIAVYAYYRWKQAPPTSLKEKDPEGINGVARNNPLYLDPTTVAEEVEE